MYPVAVHHQRVCPRQEAEEERVRKLTLRKQQLEQHQQQAEEDQQQAEEDQQQVEEDSGARLERRVGSAANNR